MSRSCADMRVSALLRISNGEYPGLPGIISVPDWLYLMAFSGLGWTAADRLQSVTSRLTCVNTDRRFRFDERAEHP